MWQVIYYQAAVPAADLKTFSPTLLSLALNCLSFRDDPYVMEFSVNFFRYYTKISAKFRTAFWILVLVTIKVGGLRGPTITMNLEWRSGEQR